MLFRETRAGWHYFWEGSDSELYIQNLNNYAWTGEIDFALIKGGLTYRYLVEDRRSRGGKERPTIWKSELQEKSPPLRTSSDSVWRDPKWRVNYNHSNMVKRLSFFSGVTGARVSIEGVYFDEWSTDSVPQC